jgi:Flp pilus assembly protein TadG
MTGRRRRAQAMVEFALILPVFMLLVAGAIEFGRAFYAYGQLQQAVQEGARYGAVLNKTNAEITARVQQIAPGGASDTVCPSSCTGTLPVCTVSPTNNAAVGGTCVFGNVVNVSASHTQTVLIPFLPIASFNLYATASVVHE